MRITRRRMTVAAIAVVGLAAAAWALRPDPIEVETAVVSRGPMRATVNAQGRTQVRQRYVIAAPVAGRVRRITLEEGDAVRPGQVVALLAPLPLDATARRQAEARLDAARALHREARVRVDQAREAATLERRAAERREVLHTAGAISQEERDRAALASESRADELAAAQARLVAATAEVEAARAMLVAGDASRGVIEVRSPCSGRVLRVPEHSERVTAAGSPLLELGDARALEVLVDVLSADAVRLAPGDPVEIVEWGGDGSLRGVVHAVEPSAFTKVSALGVDEQRVNVRVALVDPPAALGDGFRVETRMTVWEGHDVLRVPASAVFPSGGSWRLFVVRDGRARLRSVQVGRHDDASVQIVAGVPEGERVVLFPSDEVTDGVRVRVRR